DAPPVLPRIRVVHLELVVAAAGGAVAPGLLHEVLDPVRRPAAAPVGGDPVRDAAPQAVERLAGRLADHVPERDVERRERVRGEAQAANAAVGAVHALPEAL